MNAWRFAIALALAACGARSPLEVTNADAGADATPALPSIHGKYVVHYFPDSGEVIAPKDLSRATIEAYSPNEVFFGKGLADGTFIVSGVHTAMFTLRIDDQVVVDVRDGVELSDYVAGRADVDRSVTQGPFSMKLTVDGMIPLPAGGIPPAGFFHLFASNAGGVCQRV